MAGMSDGQPREIVSRRARPAKAPLNREVIVAAALDILACDGLAGLSLRRVATALDTGPASLYVYLSNLDELHALMLDSALAAVKSPSARRGSWSERLKVLLKEYLRVLYERPGLAQIALSTIACGPHSVRISELLLGLLKEGGVDDIKTAWGVDLLTLYVTAIAVEQNLRAGGDDLGRVTAALDAVSIEEFPLVFAAKQALLSGGGEGRSDWALDVIISGITGGPNPPVKLQPPRRKGRKK